MHISRDSLRGYILEEMLAYLIQNTGYRLLVDEAQDPQELGWRLNGLVVYGRGAVHQVDVLGELRWIPAFTYPLRLFVEAKFRGTKTGVGVVRNAVAVLLDVNQNNLPQVDRRNGNVPQLRPKYSYVGAIFSTSGFSAPAMDMALAHGVSLIDLGTPEFRPLLDAITAVADGMVGTRTEHVAIPAGDAADEDVEEPSASRQLLALRTAIREALGTQTYQPKETVANLSRDILPQLNGAIQAARNLGELFVGMGRGPYMLVLKANDRVAFLDYCDNHPSHDVWISWRADHNNGRTWTITPLNDPAAYSLTFRIPEVIGSAIFSAKNVQRAALDLKQAHLSEILIYRHDAGRDSLIRLKFRPEAITRRNNL